ncbi:hypothetical protein LINGRAHAP2_LOCUS14081 [Linum grandiflorum]
MGKRNGNRNGRLCKGRCTDYGHRMKVVRAASSTRRASTENLRDDRAGKTKSRVREASRAADAQRPRRMGGEAQGAGY